jgi:O-acetyl-ADP-ribose deacetylase (regulator of RNase III)
LPGPWNKSSTPFPFGHSTGVYRFPVDLAAPIALGVMAETLRAGQLREIRLYLYGQHAFTVWRQAADALFAK